MNSKKWVLLSALLAVLAFIVGAVLYQQSQTQSTAVKIAAEPAISNEQLIKFHSPALGANAPKVTLVEFFDPACEGCRAFYPVVKKIMTKNPDDVRLVLRFAAFHTGSDLVVKILLAAKKQGKFWQLLDVVMEKQPQWADHGSPKPELVWTYAESVGVDIKQARIDVANPAMDDILKIENADLVALKVKQTPTFFVNGKPLPSFGQAQLLEAVAAGLSAK